jgi:hypothetical protein
VFVVWLSNREEVAVSPFVIPSVARNPHYTSANGLFVFFIFRGFYDPAEK